MSQITVAACGLGSRGNAYATRCKEYPDEIRIVACADIVPDKVRRFSEEYHIPEEMCFSSGEEMLRHGKLADVMFICTMDRQHYAQAIEALRLGYHLLLEKPISPDLEECLEIARVAKECNRQVVVCHVLRYTPYWRKLKEIIDSGVLGEIMSIQANEQVCYWHQAHSFVRGNWRKKEETSPMIMQKCCHDMDILLWITGKHAVSVSSFGALSYFKPENAPAGAPKQCSEACPAYAECPYSVEKSYLQAAGRGEFDWPVDVVEQEPSLEKLTQTLKTSQYGRCVYQCDNDVVDHQIVNVLLEDDLTVSFTMSAFTNDSGRHIHIMGTKGDLCASMDDKTLTLKLYGKEPLLLTVEEAADKFGHGGGDSGIVRDVIDVFSGEKEALTAIDNSIESHIVALAAEESRTHNGQLVNIKEYIGSC